MGTDERPLSKKLRTAPLFWLVVFGLAAISPAFWGVVNAMGNETSRPPRAAEIVALIQDGHDFDNDEYLEIGHEPSLIQNLIALAPGQTAEIRRAILDLLIEVGRPIYTDGDGPERFAPYINNRAVISFMVTSLTDEDHELRNLAGEMLATEVPAPLLRDHSRELIDLIRENIGIKGAVPILGKTGASRARELLQANKQLQKANPRATQAALGRLGDREAESLVIAAYRRADTPRSKEEEAHRLGYMATPRAVLALARDMRTPETYIWNMQSRRSLRVHLIEGMHLAFPTEPVFWPPQFKPSDDSYYEAIEQWITENLGVTWEQPRPEFLYQEDAPVLPNPGAGR